MSTVIGFDERNIVVVMFDVCVFVNAKDTVMNRLLEDALVVVFFDIGRTFLS